MRDNLIELVTEPGARLENEVPSYLGAEISKMTNANKTRGEFNVGAQDPEGVQVLGPSDINRPFGQKAVLQSRAVHESIGAMTFVAQQNRQIQ